MHEGLPSLADKQASSPEQPCRRPDLQLLLTSPWAFVALGFGVGLSPVWPGTAGSLLGLALAWPLQWLPAAVQIVLVCAAFAVGVWACERTGRDLASPDAGAMVWDEVVGVAAVALLAPPGLAWWSASLVAFRLFDIAKPWPIHLVDRKLRNGLGVMLDDALAAAYAIAAIAILNQVASYVSP